MPVTETETTSWWGRIKNAIIGVGLGLLLVILSIVLIFWNEGRAVDAAVALAEGQGAVVSVPADSIDPTNEGKLIHIQGLVTSNSEPEDTETGVYASGSLALVRKVEMFQWVERETTSTEKKLGGSEETTTTYAYEKTWSAVHHDSSQFKNPVGHENPPMIVSSAEFVVADVAVGSFSIDGKHLVPLGRRTSVNLNEEDVMAVADILGLVGSVKEVSGAVYSGSDHAKPEIGDIVVAYERVDLEAASLVAMQNGTSLDDYLTSNGQTIFLVAAGYVGAEQLFAEAEAGNALLTWAIRLGALLMLFVGFNLTLNILSVLGDLVPVVGSVIGFGTSFVAFVAALTIGTLCVAIGWFAVRPVFAGVLLVVVTGALMIFIRQRRRRVLANAD